VRGLELSIFETNLGSITRMITTTHPQSFNILLKSTKELLEEDIAKAWEELSTLY